MCKTTNNPEYVDSDHTKMRERETTLCIANVTPQMGIGVSLTHGDIPLNELDLCSCQLLPIQVLGVITEDSTVIATDAAVGQKLHVLVEANNRPKRAA